MFFCECKECVVTDVRQVKDWYKSSKGCNYLYYVFNIDKNHYDCFYYRLNNGILNFLRYPNKPSTIHSYTFNLEKDGFYDAVLIQKMSLPEEDYNVENMANYLKKISENILFI